MPGAYDEAMEVLNKGLAIIDFDPEVWNYLGVAYWNKGNYDEARKAYDRALALDKNYPLSSTTSARSIFRSF